jgi:hypothetical protein
MSLPALLPGRAVPNEERRCDDTAEAQKRSGNHALDPRAVHLSLDAVVHHPELYSARAIDDGFVEVVPPSFAIDSALDDLVAEIPIHRLAMPHEVKARRNICVVALDQ